MLETLHYNIYKYMENIIKYNKNKIEREDDGKSRPSGRQYSPDYRMTWGVSEKKRNRRFPEIILHRSRIRSG